MEKRLELLTAASEIFMRQGIKCVTMDDLARSISVSKKTFYQFFVDKNDLVEQVVASSLAADVNMCLSVVEKSENAIASLREVMSNVIENLGNIHPDVFSDLERYHPSASVLILEKHMTFVTEFLLKNIARGRNEELYRVDFNEEIIAKMFVKLTSDIVFGHLTMKDKRLNRKVVFQEIIGFILAGMVNENGKKFMKNNYR